MFGILKRTLGPCLGLLALLGLSNFNSVDAATRTVTTDTSSTLVAPTDFFSHNAGLLQGLVTIKVMTNGVFAGYVTNVDFTGVISGALSGRTFVLDLPTGAAGSVRLQAQTNGVLSGTITNLDLRAGLTGNVANATLTLGSSLASGAAGSAQIQAQTNGVLSGVITNLDLRAGLTGNVANATLTLGASGGSGGTGTGFTNSIPMLINSVKVPATNMAIIDGSFQAAELQFDRTNFVGSNVALSCSFPWQVPRDYATNTFALRFASSILGTNGPNASNVIWGVSVARVPGGNNPRTAGFTTPLYVTNNWSASILQTNLSETFIPLGTNALIAPGDLAIVQLFRAATVDTFVGTSCIHGTINLEWTR